MWTRPEGSGTLRAGGRHDTCLLRTRLRRGPQLTLQALGRGQGDVPGSQVHRHEAAVCHCSAAAPQGQASSRERSRERGPGLEEGIEELGDEKGRRAKGQAQSRRLHARR